MVFTINNVYHILILVGYVLALSAVAYFVDGALRKKN
jgi:hypothetical protein